MTSVKDMPAFSTSTGVHYENWDALIDAESNGYVVTVLITDSKRNETWPWSIGPLPYEAAQRERARLRAKWKREYKDFPHLSYRWFVRPLWMPEPRRTHN